MRVKYAVSPSSNAPFFEQVHRRAMEVESLKHEVESKNAEIDSQRKQLEVQRDKIEQQSKEIEALKSENALLREQLEKQSIPFPEPATTEPLPPVHLATLEWSHCARLPVATSGAQCALVGGKVYVGGGTTDNQRDLTRIFRFDPERGNWYCPQARCPVAYFAMAEFQGELIVVGGIIPMVSSTGLVHRFKDLEWEEYLQPMPTARNRLSIITTESAIVACGGESDLTEMCCETVEVFTTKTGQWHTADPLPFPWYKMSSVRIGDTGYLLGGGHQSDDSTNTVVCVPLSSLIEKASSAPSSSPEGSLWKTLPPTPHYTATAAALKGQLVAVAGQDEQTYQPFLHVFIPSSNTWERMPLGDLPESTYYAAAIRLSDEKLFVCGGTNPYQELDCVYVGAIADP